MYTDLDRITDRLAGVIPDMKKNNTDGYSEVADMIEHLEKDLQILDEKRVSLEKDGFTVDWFKHWLNETFGGELTHGEIEKIVEEAAKLVRHE